mgnify:CR=1 FL=1
MPIILAAVIHFVIGMAWYSPALFGKAWAKESGMTPEKMKAAQEKGMVKQMIIAFVLGLASAFVLMHVLIVVLALMGSAAYAYKTAFFLWLGFMLPIIVSGALWGGRSHKLVAIDAGYWLTGIIAMTLVMHAMM